jgi:hypothetical protein
VLLDQGTFCSRAHSSTAIPSTSCRPLSHVLCSLREISIVKSPAPESRLAAGTGVSSTGYNTTFYNVM